MWQLDAKTAHNAPRQRLMSARHAINTMAASSAVWRWWVAKYYSARSGHIQFYTFVATLEGTPLALIESDILGRYRTGAASAVALKYLCKKTKGIVALVGAGRQAYTQATAVSKVFDCHEIRITSSRPERAGHLAKILNEKHGIAAKAVSNVPKAVADADIIVTATTASSPIVQSGDIADSSLVLAVGSNHRDRAELPADLIARANRIIVDDLEVARLDSGDLIQAEATGSFEWSRAEQLAALVGGQVPPATPGITIFESQGLAVWDLAAARAALEAAENANVGQIIGTFQSWPENCPMER